MEYSYKFRLYPTAEQQEQMSRNFGCCRYVFNHFLTQRQEQYKKTGKAPTRFQQDKSLTMLKQELPWLKEVDSTSLQATLQDLDAAFQNFFRRVKQGEKPGYPRFKSKHDHRQSYKSKCVGTNIKVLDKAVQLPKLGRVKCRISKEVKGRVLSATVSRNPSGKYFVALCCTGVEIEPLPSTGAAVGLDMGVKSFAVTSNGMEYPNHKYLSRSEKKLARLQRQLSRKSKGSNRWDKARFQVARLHEHIANQRQDTLHKLSSEIIRQNDIICIEEMRDGSLICIGKGNEEWNCSAPHGAGRLMSRHAAFHALSMEEFQKEMEGIYTTCVVPETLDESPMAYKSMDEIIDQIEPTVEIVQRIRPVYNFKASD